MTSLGQESIRTSFIRIKGYNNKRRYSVYSLETDLNPLKRFMLLLVEKILHFISNKIVIHPRFSFNTHTYSQLAGYYWI